MTDSAAMDECPADLLMGAVETLETDDERGLAQIEDLLTRYGADARLHFLKGSVLAGLRRYDEAHLSMGAAIEVAPHYALARFQLGFLQLTSNNFAEAQATWAPLLERPQDEALSLFVRGLSHIARDEIVPGIELLKEGIAANTQNMPINADMRLIIETAQRATAEAAVASGGEDEVEELTPTQMLLQQHAAKPKH